MNPKTSIASLSQGDYASTLSGAVLQRIAPKNGGGDCAIEVELTYPSGETIRKPVHRSMIVERLDFDEGMYRCWKSKWVPGALEGRG